ncbi:hypothetical protein M9Y10_041621 [Tritrichomonas musculus]|uniref:Phosphatidylinositol transfer protein N-terminal domain-containing protein n=1 Tax=Tritrichomonas musculus TaxID=1915356 RepID=A0ABR2K5V7_9EUKA
MKIYEYRIVVPVDYARYEIANRHMCLDYVKTESHGGEGIEVVKDETYDMKQEDPNAPPKKGQHTYKILHIKSKIPAFVRWAIPDKYLHFHEDSTVEYPHYYTKYTVPGFGDKFYCDISSQHCEYVCDGDGVMKNFPENALNLSDDELKERKIVWLDIVHGNPKKSENSLKDYKCEQYNLDFSSPVFSEKEDPHKAKQREEFPPFWTTQYKGPMMCAIKVVKFELNNSLKSMVEKIVTESAMPKVFVESHRRMLHCIGDWYDLTVPDMEKLEEEQRIEQKKNVKFDES